MTLEDPESGPLTMERDTGLVWCRRGEFLEPCGFIADPDNCPPGLERHWDTLLDRWCDSCRAAEGYAAAVAFSYYDRLSVRGMN